MITVETEIPAGTARTSYASRHRRPLARYAERVALYLMLIALSVAFMVPLVWMLSTSLKEQGQVFAYPPIWIPDPIRWVNYIDVLKVAPVLRWLANTATIAVSSTLGAVLSSSMVGFGFARLRFPGRNPLFLMLLATMMLPYIVTLIPQYIIFDRLGWIDTFLPMIVPAFLGGGGYNVFLVRQFYLTIPTDLDDAARIDGANNWMIWARIMMPLCRPVITAIAIFSFVGNWNDFMRPLIFLFSEQKKTLSLGLRGFVSPFQQSYHLNMAAAMYLAIPILLIFFFGQRYFLKGVVMTGLTGR